MGRRSAFTGGGRRHRIFAVAASTACIALGTVAVASTPAVAATTLYVSNSGSDTGSCPSASPCASIGYALTQAPNGATIDVAAGTYPEQLTISQSVTIDGAGTSTVIEPTALTMSETDTDSDTPQGVIVYVTPGTTGVDIENLTVNGSGTSLYNANGSCIPDYVGIYYRDATGSISNTTVTDIEQLNAFGCQPGANGGIYVATDSSMTAPSSGNGSPASWVAPGTLANADVTMNNDTVNNYDKNGITCDDVGTACTITNSIITGLGPIPSNTQPLSNGQNGVQIFGASSAVITGNSVSGDSYTSPQYGVGGSQVFYTVDGLLLINAGTLTVDNNTVTDNDQDIYALQLGPSSPPDPTPGTWKIENNNASDAENNTGTFGSSTKVPFGNGFGDGIDVDSTSNNVVVSGNQDENDVEYGLALYGANGTTLSGNTADADGDGIYVGGPGSVTASSTGNSIAGNTTENNSIDGIDATASGSTNDFSADTSGSNGADDCLDASSGHGTAATADTWTNDIGATSTPAGICSHSQPPGGEPPVFTSKDAATATVGTPFTFAVTTIGYPTPTLGYPVKVKGIKLKDPHNGTATLTDKKPKAGTYVITITASNVAGFTTQKFTLTVVKG